MRLEPIEWDKALVELDPPIPHGTERLGAARNGALQDFRPPQRCVRYHLRKLGFFNLAQRPCDREPAARAIFGALEDGCCGLFAEDDVARVLGGCSRGLIPAKRQATRAATVQK